MKKFYYSCLSIICFVIITACTSLSPSHGEEYFNLGNAYFDMGKYAEAEKWFKLARNDPKTKNAAEYNLGCIAFLNGKYEEAALIFEGLLEKDPNNIMVLKAASFSWLKAQNFSKAEKLYEQVLSLETPTTNTQYNYAVVLFALQKYEQALSVLKELESSAPDDSDILLLRARVEKALNRVEAIEYYEKWLAKGEDPLVLREYAEAAEAAGFYTRALESYQKIEQKKADSQAKFSKGELQFVIGRVLCIAEPDSLDGVTKIEKALKEEGFEGIDKIKQLLSDSRLSQQQKDAIQSMINVQ